MNGIVPSSIAPQVAQARGIIERHLGRDIAAIHLFGSAVDGGLRPHSDIDLLVTVAEPPAGGVGQALMRELLTASAPPGSSASLRPLEVTVLALTRLTPWRYPPKREMQFGEWLRDEVLAGVAAGPAEDHDLAILLTQIRTGSIPITGPDARSLFAAVPPADLTRALLDTVAQWNEPADWAGDERNIILALARCWHTAATGGITPKDRAAAWLLQRIEPPYQRVLAMARAAYLETEADDPARHPDAVRAFIAHARRAIRGICEARTPDRNA